jgi:hypothetical protein
MCLAGVRNPDSGRVQPTSLNPNPSWVHTISLNPGIGQVHIISLNPGLCQVQIRPFMGVASARKHFGRAGIHLCHRPSVGMWGYCWPIVVGSGYYGWYDGTAGLVWWGGGGGYWCPFCGEVWAMIASRERRPESSPAVMMLGGVWVDIWGGVGSCAARLGCLRGLCCLGLGGELGVWCTSHGC